MAVLVCACRCALSLRTPVRRYQMNTDVQDVIDDMTNWLAEQRRSCEWSPTWERVEEWQDELVRAIGTELCGRCGRVAIGYARLADGTRLCHADERSCYNDATYRAGKNPGGGTQ